MKRQGHFRYLADPVTVWSLIIYTANRFVLKPNHIGGWFTHDYLNDVLCLPLFVPITLFLSRSIGMRRDDMYPRAWEVVQSWFAFVVVFQMILPRFPRQFITAGDPWDVVAYAAGGLVAKLWWRRAESNLGRMQDSMQ